MLSPEHRDLERGRRPIRDTVPDVTPELDRVVARLMQKRPEARFPSMEEAYLHLANLAQASRPTKASEASSETTQSSDE